MKTSIKALCLMLAKAAALYIIFCGAFGMAIQSWPILLVGMVLLFFVNVATHMIAQNVAKEFVTPIKPENPPAE